MAIGDVVVNAPSVCRTIIGLYFDRIAIVHVDAQEQLDLIFVDTVGDLRNGDRERLLHGAAGLVDDLEAPLLGPRRLDKYAEILVLRSVAEREAHKGAVFEIPRGVTSERVEDRDTHVKEVDVPANLESALHRVAQVVDAVGEIAVADRLYLECAGGAAADCVVEIGQDPPSRLAGPDSAR